MEQIKRPFETDVEQKEINMSLSIPLDLIVNELIANSYKYAFKNKAYIANKIAIYFRSTGEPNTYKLEVIDNGVALLDDLDIKKLSSFGIQLVQELINQLHSNITKDKGTGFEIYIQELRELLKSKYPQ